MTRPFYVLIVLVLLSSCSPKKDSADVSENDLNTSETLIEVEEAEERKLLTGDDLRVWSTVNRRNEFNQEAIETLKRFFDRKMYTNEAEDFWLASDQEKYVYPRSDINYVEYDSQGNLKYYPTLMAITSAGEPTKKLMTVKWAAADSTGLEADVRYVYDFLAVQTDEGVRLSQPLDHFTKDWTRRVYGKVEYIISPQHTFSESDAEQQAEDIKNLSAFFEIEEVPLTYFSYAGPTDLFRAWGYQFHPLMYVHESGGRVDHGGHIHSGNGHDIYTHEVAHVYSHERFGDRPSLLDEGLATILGGSSEYSYEWHRHRMKEYLDSDATISLVGRTNPHVQDYVFEHTSVPYLVGGLLCERIVRREGKTGLFKVMESGKDAWPALAEYGVTEENITEIIREEIEKESIDFFNVQ